MKKDSPTSRPYITLIMIYMEKKKNIYIYALTVFQKSEAWREEKYPSQKNLLQLSVMAAYTEVSSQV